MWSPTSIPCQSPGLPILVGSFPGYESASAKLVGRSCPHSCCIPHQNTSYLMEVMLYTAGMLVKVCMHVLCFLGSFSDNSECSRVTCCTCGSVSCIYYFLRPYLVCASWHDTSDKAGISVVSPCTAAQLMHPLLMYALTMCSLSILILLSYVPEAALRSNASD